MLLTKLFAPQRNEFARHFPLFIMTEISVCSASEIMIISYNAEVHKTKKSKTTSTLLKKVTLWTFDYFKIFLSSIKPFERKKLSS